jgi:penicillin amidase
VDAAFTRALDELQQSQGADVSAWQWGKAHQARAEHRPFSKVKALARWFELRAPVGGDTYTINVSRVGLRPDATTGELYLDEHGPSLRALYDLGDKGRSRFMQSSGQSGIVFSPLYRNWVERWARVEDVPVWGGAAEHTLVLRPQP